ncbi:unknown [Clostridium sp. CAG:575]|nr:unknown [Clostridium sp. CAG:575]
MKRKLFCEYGPTAYQISVTKEAILKDLMILTS